ncbi:MAG: cyclic nucleotide-binding domain-containing protein [Verrucomicrobia bacterium]|nr:cyclic nucleotide-binding domain-containing protein [Verrucomicrobiota bacterium]
MDSRTAAAGYKIWGVDNVVYGPVELPVLVEWIQEERVTGDTWIFSLEKDAWQRAQATAELRVPLDKLTQAKRGGDSGTEFSPLIPGVRPGSLRRVKILADMTDQQLGRFAQLMEVEPVPQFREIVKQGDPGNAMYLVLEGEVRVRLMIQGKESTLVTLGAGEFFGETSLFDEGPRSADVVANQDSVLLKISAANFRKLTAEHADLATQLLLAIARTLVARIRADNKRFKDSVRLSRAWE